MFQEFSQRAVGLDEARSAPPTPADEVRTLIKRYPNLSETELARLINNYRGLSALDLALMLSEERLAPNLDRFSSDHRSKIRLPFRQYAGLLAYAVIGLFVVAWAVSYIV